MIAASLVCVCVCVRKPDGRLLRFTLAALVVVGHLKTGPPETTLHVEALVGLAAVQDALVAAHLLRDVVEGLDYAQPQLLALLVFGDGDVLDVADEAEVVDTREKGAVVR